MIIITKPSHHLPLCWVSGYKDIFASYLLLVLSLGGGHTAPNHHPEVLLGRAGGLIYLGWWWLEGAGGTRGHISVFSVRYWQSLTVDTTKR